MRKIPIDPFLLFAVQKTTVPTFASRTVAVAATKVTSGTSSPCTPIDKKCNLTFSLLLQPIYLLLPCCFATAALQLLLWPAVSLSQHVALVPIFTCIHYCISFIAHY